MLDRATRAQRRPRVWSRARAEELPWRDASFDRVFCVNALHHFADRARFFAEARRVLRPGGGLLTIGKDPHTDRDDWWVYDYFEETRAIDRDALRARADAARRDGAGRLRVDRVDGGRAHRGRAAGRPKRWPTASSIRRFTSQLTVLSDEEFTRGADRLRQANDAAGGELQLVADFRLYATIGWV